MADRGASGIGKSDRASPGERLCRGMMEFCFGKMDDAEWASVLSGCETCVASWGTATKDRQVP